jgi:hypothetical protein
LAFDPSDNGGRWIYQLESSQPDNRDYNRVECHYLGVQRTVVNARCSLLAAAMRRRHVVRLPALALHRATAGALFGAHLRVLNHAGHRRGQTRHQQQNQHPELAENMHDQDQSTAFFVKDATCSMADAGTLASHLSKSLLLRTPYQEVRWEPGFLCLNQCLVYYDCTHEEHLPFRRMPPGPRALLLSHALLRLAPFP